MPGAPGYDNETETGTEPVSTIVNVFEVAGPPLWQVSLEVNTT